MPFALDPDFFVKKLTVKGNNGYMQGIVMANNPPKKPARNIAHKVLGFPSSALACSAAAALILATDLVIAALFLFGRHLRWQYR